MVRFIFWTRCFLNPQTTSLFKVVIFSSHWVTKSSSTMMAKNHSRACGVKAATCDLSAKPNIFPRYPRCFLQDKKLQNYTELLIRCPQISPEWLGFDLLICPRSTTSQLWGPRLEMCIFRLQPINDLLETQKDRGPFASMIDRSHPWWCSIAMRNYQMGNSMEKWQDLWL